MQVARMHVYGVRPRKDHRGVDLISDVLPFGRLWYDTPENAIGYAMRVPILNRHVRRGWSGTETIGLAPIRSRIRNYARSGGAPGHRRAADLPHERYQSSGPQSL